MDWEHLKERQKQHYTPVTHTESTGKRGRCMMKLKGGHSLDNLDRQPPRSKQARLSKGIHTYTTTTTTTTTTRKKTNNQPTNQPKKENYTIDPGSPLRPRTPWSPCSPYKIDTKN